MSGVIGVSMEGVKDAVETFKEIILPFQKQQAERKIKLENAFRQADIQRLNAEALAAEAKAQHEKAATIFDLAQAELALAQAKKLEADVKLVLAQAEKTLVEATKERELLKLERIKLAMQIVEKYNPNADGVEKISFIMQLLPNIEQLLSGPVVTVQ